MNVNEIIVTIRDRAGGEINPDVTLPDEQLVLEIARLKDQLTALTESPDAGTAERGSLWMQLHTECDQLREQLDAARHGTEVTSVYICKLPYQEHPFVHGARDGHDVWLRSNGQWTDIEDAPDADIPLYGDISIVGKNENIEIEHLKSLLTDARHGTELAESEVAGRDQEIKRLKRLNATYVSDNHKTQDKLKAEIEWLKAWFCTFFEGGDFHDDGEGGQRVDNPCGGYAPDWLAEGVAEAEAARNKKETK